MSSNLFRHASNVAQKLGKRNHKLFALPLSVLPVCYIRILVCFFRMKKVILHVLRMSKDFKDEVKKPSKLVDSPVLLSAAQESLWSTGLLT